MKSATTKSILLAATALSVAATATPAMAADDDVIIVTAQRAEERLQDVPISITVLSQEELSNNNISTAKDIANYTPNVVANQRFGSDQTTFTIRGFTQAQRTTATVGVYFADVIAPRGTGVLTGGDGAGPGQLFDLENIQVLKGPQGTLFGRNTSGGAVLLVPTKPKDELEGYIEGTVGNFNRRRIEAVLNLPISDTFRIRLGLDSDKNDGYLKNLGFSTPHGEDMANTDYWSFRASAVWDIAPNVENYTIGYYTDSRTSGAIPSVKGCFGRDANGINQQIDPFNQDPAITPTRFVVFPTGQDACDQIKREAPHGFWTVSNSNPQGGSLQKQMQIINRTSWQATDNLTITNIFSYAEHRSNASVSAFGDFSPTPGLSPAPGNVNGFAPIQDDPASGWTASESTLVEELRFNGEAVDGRFTWQAGLYYELSRPLGWAGQQQGLFTPCVNSDTLNCVPANFNPAAGVLSFGRMSYSSYRTRWEGKAIYGQGSFDITDKFGITAGIRYTQDKSSALARLGTVFPGATPEASTFTCTNATAPKFGQVLPVSARYDDSCTQLFTQKTSAPTWTIVLDYKPVDDVLIYAKWTRGYRQGAVAPASPDTLQTYDEEKIDSYEVGLKAAWRGAVPGSFNIAGYYNDFSGQILQLGVQCDPTAPNYKGPCSPSTTLINAGKSRLYGFEADLTIRPVDGLIIKAAYAYLNTKLQEVVIPTLPVNSSFNRIRGVAAGEELPFTIPHSFTGSINYTLPLNPDLGEISIGGTLVHRSSWFNTADSAPPPADDLFIGMLPSRTWGNVHLSWKSIAGGPVDAVFYVTNITNEKMFAQGNDQVTRGFSTFQLEAPRQFGMRVKYRFGRLAN